MTQLQKIRKTRNISQAKLARLLKLTRATVCQTEKDGIKTIRTAERYAPFLNCDPQELLEFSTRAPRA